MSFIGLVASGLRKIICKDGRATISYETADNLEQYLLFREDVVYGKTELVAQKSQ